jgi:ribonuclease R
MSKYWKKHLKSRSRASKHQGELREGVIQHHGRFAFLLSEKEGEPDVFLSGHGLGLAMNGDRVCARVRREVNGRYAGEVLKVITRAHTTIVGILKQFPHGWTILPEKRDVPPAQVIGFAHKVAPVAGDLAVLEVTQWPTETAGAAGIVTEVLGNPDNATARITAIKR